MSNRKSKNEKEREKIVQDRLQILLTRMLQDDDNKYCVDCDSKGKIKQKSIHKWKFFNVSKIFKF